MEQRTSEDFNILRREVKKKMVDLDIDLPGERKELLQQVGEKLGRRVSPAQFSMALAGSRKTNASRTLLETALSVMKITEERHANA